MTFKRYLKFLFFITLPIFIPIVLAALIISSFIPQALQRIACIVFAVLYMFPIIKFIEYVVDKDVI